MSSFVKFIAAVGSGFVATCGVAFANVGFVPEPGSIALVGVAVAGLIAFSRKKKK